jgi:cell division protein FtsW
MGCMKRTAVRVSAHGIETVVLLLMAIGTVFVFSASASVQSNYDWKHFYRFTGLRNLLYFPLAVICMYITASIDYHRFDLRRIRWYHSLTPWFLGLSIFLLGLALVPGVGQGIGEDKAFARRWLFVPLGSMKISFQPSELAKWCTIIYLAAYLDRYEDSIKRFWKRFVPAWIVPGVVILLIVTQDFGTAAFIAMLSFLMLLIGGARLWHFLTPLPVILPAFYFAVVSSPTRLNRIKNFLEPGNLPYQAIQSLIAISTNGLGGAGLGRGVTKYGHLPEDTSDFIFAVIAEEMGFGGCVVVLLLFILLVVLGLIVIYRCRDRFGKMLASGIVMAIGIQAAINIGVVTVVLPTKGIPLPFVSAGGTSLLLTASAIGILLNIAKHNSELGYYEPTKEVNWRFERKAQGIGRAQRETAE